MNDELNKDNYRILQNKINIIKSKLTELEELHEDLILNTKNAFRINNKIIFEDDFDKTKQNLKTIKEETINEIIPSINNKI